MTAFPEAMRASEHGDALYEIVNGVRVELPSMGVYSSFLALALLDFLRPFARRNQLGRGVNEILFILDKTTNLRRRPDVAFVSVERWALDRPVPATGDWPVVPDLAVEVNSPHDLIKDVLAKIHEYFSHGVKQVWLIDPDFRQIYVYDSPTQVRILSDAETLDNTVIPGFSLNIGDLFREVQSERP